MTPEEWDELIAEKAALPKDSRSGDKSVTEHDLSDLIAARNSGASSTASEIGSRGLYFSATVPPGPG